MVNANEPGHAGASIRSTFIIVSGKSCLTDLITAFETSYIAFELYSYSGIHAVTKRLEVSLKMLTYLV